MSDQIEPVAFASIADLSARVGTTLGTSSWRAVPQEQIDAFADVTDDHQWIHVDRGRAAEGSFGTTIAHGFLVLSLLPSLSAEVFRLDESITTINYGFDRVRFVHPVRSGRRVRVRVTLQEVASISSGSRITVRSTIEVDEAEGPTTAVVAEMIFLAA